MKRWDLFGIGSLLVFWCCAAYCPAGIIVDHQPHPSGGPGSDTDFLYGGVPVWQRLADNFTVAQSAIIRHVAWWGFYDQDNPPDSETMRLRFYGQRPNDALPDENQILLEEYVSNPTRVATGRFILTGVAPLEYRFDLDLTTPQVLPRDVPYWIEIIQIGDLSTAFRWEDSLSNRNGHAFINEITGDWRHTQVTIGDLAFQLSTIPEPSTAVLLCISCTLLWLCNWKREEAFRYN